MRMDGRAVECNGLENRRGFASSVSSNLTPSAIVSSSLWQHDVFFVHHGHSSLSLISPLILFSLKQHTRFVSNYSLFSYFDLRPSHPHNPEHQRNSLHQNHSAYGSHLSPDYFLGTEYFLELGANAA